MNRVLLAICFAAAALTLHSQEIVLDIDTAVEMAIDNNLGLQSHKIGAEMKKRTRDSVWNYFIPKISATATLSHLLEQPGEPEVEITATGIEFSTVEGDPRWNVSFGFNATLTLTSQLFFGIKHTILDYETSLINIEMAEKKLRRDVKKTFLNLILLEKNMQLMQQNIDTAEKRYNQANVNYENGLVSEYDKLSARVAWQNLKPAKQDMQVGYRNAILAFKQLIGLDRGTGLRIQGTIDSAKLAFDTEQLIRDYVGGRLDIESLGQSLKILENTKQVTISSLFPTLTIMFSMDPTFMKDPFKDEWFEDVDDDWVQRGGMFGVTLTVPLDGLIPGSGTWVSIADTEDSIRRTQMALARARQGAELEIESIVMGLDKSMQAIDTLKLNVELAQRAYQMAEEAYNVGARELLDVQNAEVERQKARLEVLKEEYNYTTGLLDLEYALNAKLDEVGKK